MPACDLAALFSIDEAAERVRASQALPLVRRVEEDCSDFRPGAVEDRPPLFPCLGQLPPPGAFALEVLESDLEPRGIFFDALDDEAAGVEDPGVDVWVADAALFGLDAHLLKRGDAFGTER